MKQLIDATLTLIRTGLKVIWLKYFVNFNKNSKTTKVLTVIACTMILGLLAPKGNNETTPESQPKTQEVKKEVEKPVVKKVDTKKEDKVKKEQVKKEADEAKKITETKAKEEQAKHEKRVFISSMSEFVITATEIYDNGMTDKQNIKELDTLIPMIDLENTTEQALGTDAHHVVKVLTGIRKGEIDRQLAFDDLNTTLSNMAEMIQAYDTYLIENNLK